MDKQRGRPVLVEFWDFCRPSSLRTLPYVKAWHERYAADGLRVVTVHSPRLRARRGRGGRPRGRRAPARSSTRSASTSASSCGAPTTTRAGRRATCGTATATWPSTTTARAATPRPSWPSRSCSGPSASRSAPLHPEDEPERAHRGPDARPARRLQRPVRRRRGVGGARRRPASCTSTASASPSSGPARTCSSSPSAPRRGRARPAGRRRRDLLRDLLHAGAGAAGGLSAPASTPSSSRTKRGSPPLSSSTAAPGPVRVAPMAVEVHRLVDPAAGVDELRRRRPAATRWRRRRAAGPSGGCGRRSRGARRCPGAPRPRPSRAGSRGAARRPTGRPSAARCPSRLSAAMASGKAPASTRPRQASRCGRRATGAARRARRPCPARRRARRRRARRSRRAARTSARARPRSRRATAARSAGARSSAPEHARAQALEARDGDVAIEVVAVGGIDAVVEPDARIDDVERRRAAASGAMARVPIDALGPARSCSPSGSGPLRERHSSHGEMSRKSWLPGTRTTSPSGPAPRRWPSARAARPRAPRASGRGAARAGRRGRRAGRRRRGRRAARCWAAGRRRTSTSLRAPRWRSEITRVRTGRAGYCARPWPPPRSMGSSSPTSRGCWPARCAR